MKSKTAAVLLFILLAGCISDQMSKNWAAKNLRDKPVVVAIDNFLEFGYTENHGMVFGLNNRSDNTVSKNLLLVVRILMSIGLIIYIVIRRQSSLISHVPLVLILSGAIGNVIDSLRFGHVIDFIHIHAGTLFDWPFFFNLADAFVCIGMVMLLIQSFIADRKKGNASKAAVATPV